MNKVLERYRELIDWARNDEGQRGADDSSPGIVALADEVIRLIDAARWVPVGEKPPAERKIVFVVFDIEGEWKYARGQYLNGEWYVRREDVFENLLLPAKPLAWFTVPPYDESKRVDPLAPEFAEPGQRIERASEEFPKDPVRDKARRMRSDTTDGLRNIVNDLRNRVWDLEHPQVTVTSHG